MQLVVQREGIDDVSPLGEHANVHPCFAQMFVAVDGLRVFVQVSRLQPLFWGEQSKRQHSCVPSLLVVVVATPRNDLERIHALSTECREQFRCS